MDAIILLVDVAINFVTFVGENGSMITCVITLKKVVLPMKQISNAFVYPATATVATVMISAVNAAKLAAKVLRIAVVQYVNCAVSVKESAVDAVDAAMKMHLAVAVWSVTAVAIETVA